MSRIGKKPIIVPGNCKVAVNASTREVAITGPKGETLKVSYRPEISVAWNEKDRQLVCSTDMARIEEGDRKAFWGTTRANLNNCIKGVTEGYSEKLEIIGVGYRATAKGDTTLDLALSFSHPVSVKAPAGITFEVPAPTQILIKGTDKETVGQVAADIRAIRKPEPYKGKGVRYKGEYVARKAGKAGK